MKKIIYTIAAFSIYGMTSCGSETISTENAPKEIKKEVKAEIINGETSVTITTTEDGKATNKTLTGLEAETYLAENKLEEGKHNEDAEVIVKSLNSSPTIDVDQIMSDPELNELDAKTREKVKKALENALKESETHIESDDNQQMKTKIIIKEEKEQS